MHNYVLNQKIRQLENLLYKAKNFSSTNKENCYFCAVAITSLMMGDKLNSHRELYSEEEYLEWIESFYQEFYALLIINNFKDLQSQLDLEYVYVKVESN